MKGSLFCARVVIKTSHLAISRRWCRVQNECVPKCVILFCGVLAYDRVLDFQVPYNVRKCLFMNPAPLVVAPARLKKAFFSVIDLESGVFFASCILLVKRLTDCFKISLMYLIYYDKPTTRNWELTKGQRQLQRQHRKTIILLVKRGNSKYSCCTCCTHFNRIKRLGN